jgi:predicted lipid-binding transport protein (Tim44 family)
LYGNLGWSKSPFTTSAPLGKCPQLVPTAHASVAGPPAAVPAMLIGSLIGIIVIGMVIIGMIVIGMIVIAVIVIMVVIMMVIIRMVIVTVIIGVMPVTTIVNLLNAGLDDRLGEGRR